MSGNIDPRIVQAACMVRFPHFCYPITSKNASFPTTVHYFASNKHSLSSSSQGLCCGYLVCGALSALERPCARSAHLPISVTPSPPCHYSSYDIDSADYFHRLTSAVTVKRNCPLVMSRRKGLRSNPAARMERATTPPSSNKT